MEEYDIDKLVSNMDFNSGKLNNINGLLLTNREIEVLDKYKIPYKNCSDLKQVLFEIEEVQMSISERDYYENTNK